MVQEIVFRFLQPLALSSHKMCQRSGSRADFLKFLHGCVTQLTAIYETVITGQSGFKPNVCNAFR